MSDQAVTVQLDISGGTCEQYGAGIERHGDGFLRVHRDDARDTLVSRDYVLCVTGTDAALAALSSPPPIQSGVEAMQTRDADSGDDAPRERCPECGEAVFDSLGGARACSACGWSANGENEEGEK